MKNFFFALFFCFTLLNSFSDSSAQTLYGAGSYLNCGNNCTIKPIYASPAAAGEALCAVLVTNGATGYYHFSSVDATYVYCYLQLPDYPASNPASYAYLITVVVADCPSGSIRLPDGSCSIPCVPPAVSLPDGSCVVPPRDCNVLKGSSYSGYIPVSANPASVCQDGCSASVVNASNQASVDGQQVIAGTFSYSGTSCTGNDITGGTPPVCPAGQCVGQINGANACFTCSAVNQTATTYTATSDSTIKTTTYNADDSVTTSVTDTVAGTSSPSITTPKTEQQSYCEQNPTAITCIDTDDQPVTLVEPSLENTPTGASIFSAIKDFVQIQPSNFAHVSQCPVSSFAWNGQTFVIDQHCALVTNHWSILSTAMLTAWTVLSLFVVLKA